MRLTMMKHDFSRAVTPFALSRWGYRAAASALVIGAALGFGMDAAQAGPLDARATKCSVNTNGGKGPKTKTDYVGYSPAMWAIRLSPRADSYALPSNKAPGELLFSTNEKPMPWLTGGGQGAASPLYACPMNANEFFNGFGSRVAGFSDVYQTNLTGIGYRVYYYISDTNGSAAAPWSERNSFASGALVYPFNGNSEFGSNVRTRIDFVATGQPISAGKIYGLTVGGQGSTDAPIAGAAPAYLNIRVDRDITITSPTCSVSNPTSLTVKLPDIKTTELATGVGPETVSKIDVSCTAASLSAPKITISSPYRYGNSPNILRNSKSEGAGGALGVGVQLQIVSPLTSERLDPMFGTAQANLAYNGLGGGSSDSWIYLLSLRYARTGTASEVKAGDLQTQAILTFTYN